MNRKILVIGIFCTLISCNSNRENPVLKTNSNSSHTIVQAINESNSPQNLISDDRWKEYENMGDPDTALTLWAYRISKQLDTSYECYECHIRLYNESEKIKDYLSLLFRSDSSIMKITYYIDTINIKFRKFAENTVNAEVKEYGTTDGRLDEFISSLKER